MAWGRYSPTITDRVTAVGEYCPHAIYIFHGHYSRIRTRQIPTERAATVLRLLGRPSKPDYIYSCVTYTAVSVITPTVSKHQKYL